MSATSNQYVSTVELAQYLGISVVAVCKRIRKNQIKAVKVGRSYVIPCSYVEDQHPDFPSPKLPLEEYVSVIQAAELLSVHRMTIIARIKSGRLEAKRVGRHYVIRKSDLFDKKSTVQHKQVGAKSEYLSVMQVAELLGKDRRTIHQAIVRGFIKASKVGRHYVIARNDVPIRGRDFVEVHDQVLDYMSVADAAKLLQISRIAVFKRIQKGKIPAERMGRSYAIRRSFFVNDD